MINVNDFLEKNKLFTVPVKDTEHLYRPIDLIDLGGDVQKPIIIEIGGARMPLRHAYVITEEHVKENALAPKMIGCVVFDLDV